MHILAGSGRRSARILASLLIAALLGACGGADSAPGASPVGRSIVLAVELPATSPELAHLAAVPLFHAAPVLLAEPDSIDSERPDASAHRAPHTQLVPAQLASLSTRRLTLERLRSAALYGVPSFDDAGDEASATPLASNSVVATYTPAQIRAAYGLPALPSPGSSVTSAQAAQMGAGQTIYLVDANDDPNAATELATFNQQFGLPACTSSAVPVNATLPLAAASATAGCSFSVVYSAASGGMTAVAPAYDSGWATEIALDVQWAHATAPLARIVLIEAPDSGVNSLAAAVAVANSMGPGVVSMSFGAAESSWTAEFDPTFSVANMTYIAAAGDAGAEVEWPAVSTHVVAVGGTSLSYSGSGARSEVAWSGTGGGISRYVAAPAWQASIVPGMGSPTHREVTDVSFNADPATGEYLAVITPGSSSAGWMSAGGTSLATPQWAGVIAIANALRAQASQSPLGAPHAELYGQISAAPATYASAFLDVTQGSDGSCASCYAEAGYDLPTGLGTPNVTSLLGSLDSAATPVASPVVTPATISGTTGSALSFCVSVTASDPVSFALSNAPAGMSISPAGLVTWAAPILGSHAVTVTATDTQTGLAGHGTYTVAITAPKPPVVAAAKVSGTAGTALTFTPGVTDANPYTLTLSGAPSGMTASSQGVLAWSDPTAGTHSITVTAKDAKTGLTGKGVITLVIAAAKPPVVTSAAVTGHAGTGLSYAVAVTHANPVTFTLSGAPSGLSINASGLLSWANPVAGKYAVSVTALDTQTRLSGKGVLTVTIAPSGPVITAAALAGVAGKPLTGTITLSDATSSSLTVSVSNVPAGMTLAVSGAALTLRWASPVTGTYTLGVSAVDGNGQSASLNLRVTISAH